MSQDIKQMVLPPIFSWYITCARGKNGWYTHFGGQKPEEGCCIMASCLQLVSSAISFVGLLVG